MTSLELSQSILLKFVVRAVRQWSPPAVYWGRVVRHFCQSIHTSCPSAMTARAGIDLGI